MSFHTNQLVQPLILSNTIN